MKYTILINIYHNCPTVLILSVLIPELYFYRFNSSYIILPHHFYINTVGQYISLTTRLNPRLNPINTPRKTSIYTLTIISIPKVGVELVINERWVSDCKRVIDCKRVTHCICPSL